MSREFSGSRAALWAAICLAAGAQTAFADTIEVKLSGAEETPPVSTAASGVAKFEIAADHTVTGTIQTKGVEGIMAHVHVGAPGHSGPPIITLTKGADGTWSIPAGSKLTDEQYESLESGNLYVNVHSAEHKPGEIRGQLKP